MATIPYEHEELIKDPLAVEPFHIVWCSKDNTNDGTTSDTGELQSAVIVTSEWDVETGLTEDSENQAAVTIKGIVYAIDTVATIWLSGGVAGNNYTCTNTITTDDGRTSVRAIEIHVRDEIA